MVDKVNAIVLAGTSSKKKRLINEHDGKGPKNPSLVKINKSPVIKNIVQALQNCDYINHDKIAIVGPEQDLKQAVKDKSIHYLPEKRSFIENCVGTYDYLSPNGEKTLFLPCDLPFISYKTINDFLKQCSNYDARYHLSVINVKNIPKEIEPFKKTMKFHLRGKGYYRIANMHLFEGAGIQDRKPIEHYVRTGFEGRRVTSLATLFKFFWLGAKFKYDIAKYFCPKGLKTRGLTEKEIETSIEKKLGISFKIIETIDWRAAADIDYQPDYEFFKKNYERLKQKADLIKII